MKQPQSPPVRYEYDIVAWANEQAALLRAGQFSALDIEHLAEEIEDVGKSEQRELASRMAVLIAHLLKWQYQPGRRSNSWLRTIKVQRERIELAIRRTPSLKSALQDEVWQRDIWLDAVEQAAKETGLDTFPENCTWSIAQVMEPDFYPGN